MTKLFYYFFSNHQSSRLHGLHGHGVESYLRALVVLMLASVSVLTYAQTPLDETEVYERIMKRKYMDGYREGTPWDNSHKYSNTVELFGYPAGCYGGGGCFAFMVDMMEYASNYEYPIRKIVGTYNNLPEIHVGDGIRVNNDGHSVVVISIDDDGHTVTVAEGNYDKSVHWGRVIDLADSNNGFTYLATFWPEPEPVDVTIDECGYATFYYANSAYVIPNDVEAKYVENINGRTLTLHYVDDIIPKKCAVILEGKPGVYTFQPTKEKGVAVPNMLRGTELTKKIDLEDEECKYYKLTTKNGKVGFFYGAKNGGIFENQAHKAYLPVPVSLSDGVNCFTFDDATGINNMQATDMEASHAIYNLSGQLVNDSYKGVVIINGKKVLRK